MRDRYRVLYRGGEGETVEKKSRFIATIRPVESQEEAAAFIAMMKKQYWDASHNCSAFTVGENNEVTRCSDDGEPAQTAGRPMLDVLLGEEIHNVCAVVTRYFGGTLLGTGGLVRAYSQAVKEGLNQCVVLEKILAEKLVIKTDYSDLGKIQYILGEQKITILDSDYSDSVAVTVLAPVSEADGLKKKLTEGTAGRCRTELLDKVYYGENGKEIVIL